MKKTLLILLGVFAVIATILFTPIGESLVLLPAANVYLKHKLPKHRIRLERLEAGMSSLRVAGTVDGTIRFEAQGPVHWVPLRFDLPYRIRAKEVVIERKRYPVQLDLHGELKGTPKKIVVSGEGEGFDAKLRYAFTVLGQEIHGIEAKAEGARIDQLLALAGQPPYAMGLLDLDVNIPSYSATVQKGGLDFIVRNGRINTAILRKNLRLDLPSVKEYTLQGSFRLTGKLLKGEASFHSAVLDLNLKDFRSDRELKIFKSGYRLKIPELSRLKRLTRTPLYGPWKMEGEFYWNRSTKLLQLAGRSPSLGGQTRFFYDHGALDLRLAKVQIPALLAMTGQPPLVASGRIDATARFKDLKNLDGHYRVAAGGRWNRKEILKLVGSDPGERLSFELRSEGRLHKSLLLASAHYRSPLLNLQLDPLKYEWVSGAMEGKYRLDFPDLHRLRLFAKARGSYPAKLTGDMSYLPIKKLLRVRGESRSFGGKVSWLYQGKGLDVTLQGVDAKRLAGLMGVPSLFKRAKLDGKVQITDLDKKLGVYSLKLDTLLDPQRLRKLYAITLPKPLPMRLRAEGRLRGEAATLRADLESGWGKLLLRKGIYDFKNGRFQSRYALTIPELSRLAPITGRRYRGPLAVAGRLEWAGKLHITGSGKEWGGRLDYALEGSLLRIRTQGMEIAQVMKVLDISPLLTGKAQSDLRYNLQSGRGTLKVESRGIRLIPSPLTQAVSLLLKRDLSRELFSQALLSAQIDPAKILFDFHAASSRTQLEIRGGKIDRKGERIDAVLNIVDHGHRYKVRIRGPLKHPVVIPMMTQALERKLGKVIKNKKIRKKIDKVIEGGSPVGKFLQKLF